MQFEPLSELEWERLEQALQRWVELHPRRDRATLAFMGRDYSPEDILDEVAARSDFGQQFAGFLYDASRRFDTPIEIFVERAMVADQNLR